ncbi:MAG TPA: acyltransferase [Noviherbaspirillum sp.]
MSEGSAREVADRLGKVIFADQLRAVAALCVMIVHLLGSYWAVRDVVAHHIFAPVLEGPSDGSLQLISHSYFNFGPFGVALFFLVSGFVIPFSLAKATRMRFLTARALRIYPTYFACLCLSLLVIWLSSRFWGVAFGWDARQIVRNALLVHNLAGIESIDMVNWSLAIEIKFYLIACMMASWITRGRILPALLLSVGLALFIGCVAYLLPADFLPIQMKSLAHDLLFIPFMLVGTMYSFHFRGLITAGRLIVSAVALFGIFIAAWPHTILKDQFPLVPLNYFYAFAVFSAAYACRRYCRPIKPLDWLASISYPLYALHSLIGYASLRFLMAQGIGYYSALAVAVAIIISIAYVVHRTVEMPTLGLGKRIMRRAAAADDSPSVQTAVAASARRFG